MPQHANKKEMDRRKAKKSHELFDERLENYLETLTQKKFNEWADKYPKEAMAFAIARMPKVPIVDQDLQKSVISLRGMMEDLPDSEDLYEENRKLKRRMNVAENKGLKDDAEIKAMRAKINQLQKKLKK